jgi:hypothetical protein
MVTTEKELRDIFMGWWAAVRMTRRGELITPTHKQQGNGGDPNFGALFWFRRYATAASASKISSTMRMMYQDCVPVDADVSDAPTRNSNDGDSVGWCESSGVGARIAGVGTRVGAGAGARIGSRVGIGVSGI